MIPERFKLEPHDRTNPMWQRIERHMVERLDALRRQNDATTTPERTEHIRGRIAQLKELLALADEPRPMQP